MIINHNASAAFANRSLGGRVSITSKNMEKLSTGSRINRASDDAAGLAVSEKMKAQIKGLSKAEENIQHGISLIRSTEGYLNETQAVLQRIRELSVSSSNGMWSTEDRMQIQVEVSQLVDEVNRIASHANFNGMNLLTGRFASNSVTGEVLQFHIGANMDQNEKVSIATMTAKALGLISQQENGKDIINIKDPESANTAIGTIDRALQSVSRQRADLGAYENRFELAQQGVSIARENLAAAESILSGTDMAAEVMKFVKNQILTQANTAMLAQANNQSQSVLKLLN